MPTENELVKNEALQLRLLGNDEVVETTVEDHPYITLANEEHEEYPF